MGKKAYDKCIEVMKQVKRDGYDKEIPAVELAKLIRMLVGADSRTVSNYIGFLKDFGFVDPIGKGVFTIKKIFKEIY